SNVFDGQEFLNIAMVYIKIGRKSTPANAALRDHVHGRVIKFHKRNRPGRFSVVSNSSTAVTQLPEITGGTSANLGLHNHLAQFMGDALNIVGHMHVETGNR